MTDHFTHTTDSSNLLQAWIKMTSDFWTTMLSSWTQMPGNRPNGTKDRRQTKGRTQESIETVLETWQTLSSLASDPGAQEALQNLGSTAPNLMMKMAQATWKGFFDLQQQWLEKAGRISQSSKKYAFDDLDSETFKTWADIYEKEFQPFFNIPQLGLTRFYQEKINQTLDYYNRFQTAFGEYMALIFLPVEKSLKEMQHKMTRMADEGHWQEDYNSLYRTWIKILEGHYMTLFKSDEYIETMSAALDALEQFKTARDAVVRDGLKSLEVPTQSDMDDLYKEVYQLKKKIRALEKDRTG